MGGGGSGDDVARPVAAMVLVQVVFAGVNIFYKLAVSNGMDMRVLVAYRYLFASAFLAPLAYFIERYIYIYNRSVRCYIYILAPPSYPLLPSLH
jgi:hypothetical protein